MQGLDKARAVLADRTQVAREAQREGRSVLGYLSVHVPLELLTALGVAPFRVFGDLREPVTEADRGLPPAFCPYLRSVLDLALKGKLDFLDGFLGSHACDAQEKTVRILPSLKSFPYTHYLDLPSNIGEDSVTYFRNQIVAFQKSLEGFVGRKLAEEDLLDAIAAHNEQRALVRELYGRNRAQPPALTGAEMLSVTTSLQTLDVAQGNQLLRAVLEEVETRAVKPPAKGARVLVWGGVLHDPVYMELIEDAGASVVIDDLDEGTKPYWDDVSPGDDPYLQLARKYLVGLYASRTFRAADTGAARKDHLSDLEARFGYLGRFVRDWKVDGVVLQSVRYCDPHGADVVDVMDCMEVLGIPSIYLEHSYSEGGLAPLRTRIEAFVETLE